MKIPSFFRLPRHQRFDIQPRHYDPIKDEIEQKRKRVRRLIDIDRKNGIENAHAPGARIEGAFRKNSPRKDNSSFLRLGLGAILFSGVVGYLYFGEYVLYATLGVALIYLLVKKMGIF